MNFSVKLFTIKGNSVFMNSLYHKVTVASVGIALSLALGTDKQAKAATITLRPLQFATIDWDGDGLGDSYYYSPLYGTNYFPVGGFDNYNKNEKAKATYE